MVTELRNGSITDKRAVVFEVSGCEALKKGKIGVVDTYANFLGIDVLFPGCGKDCGGTALLRSLNFPIRRQINGLLDNCK